jgi:hypothetical protein
MTRCLTVFLSSPVRGLEEIRRQVRDGLAAHYEVRNSEDWPARHERPWAVCRDEVQASDVLVLLLGRRYGSPCPDMPGTSFTEAEYRTAIQADVPVLAFNVTGLPDPDRDGQADAARLEQFRETVRVQHAAPDVDAAEVVQRVQESVAAFERREGTGGGPHAPFQRWDVRYHGDLTGEGYFHHRHPLVGRDLVVDAVLAFLRSSDQVGILVGEAGMGKSRLLIEVARRHGKNGVPRLRFISAAQQAVAPEALQALPHEDTVVVIDDAHARDTLFGDIEVLLARRTPPMRLLLATRPEGLARVRAALRSLDPVKLPELTDLKSDGRSLAEQLLGFGRSDDARLLAFHSGGSPLFITVGGEMLRSGELSLADVVSEEDFRSRVFDRILAGPEGGPLKSPEERDVLNVLAAVGPINANGEEVVCLAEIGGMTRSRCAEGLTRALESGVVRRRGLQIAIVPDLLGDYVLRRACVTSMGYPTDFLTTLQLEASDARLLANVVRNALVAQFLEHRAGRSVDLLGSLWGKMRAALEGASSSAVRAAVDRLLPVAHLSPRDVLEVARQAAARANAPGTERWEHEQLLESVANLLGECSRDESVSTEAAAELLHLVKDEPHQERRACGPASRRLEEIAAYGWPPAYKRQLGVIAAAMEAFRRGEAVDALVPAILGKALDREGEWTTADERSLTIHSFAIPSERSSAVRLAALEGLYEIALSRSPTAAAWAVKDFSSLLSLHPGKLGREGTSEEREGWVPEARNAEKRLLEIALSAPLFVIRSLARRRLQERRRGGFTLLPILRDRRFGAGQFPVEARIADALFTPIDEGVNGERQWEQAQKRHLRACRWLAREIVSMCGSAPAALDLIHPVAEEVRVCDVSSETYDGANVLVHGLAEVRPDWVVSLHDGICARDGFLATGLWQAYAVLISLDRKCAARECCGRALASAHAEVRAYAAHALSLFAGRPPVEVADVALIQRAVASADLHVRRLAVGAIRFLAKHDRATAKRILLAVDAGGEHVVADAILAQVGDSSIPFGELTADEVAVLLGRVPHLSALSVRSQTLHVSTFLREVASAHTRAFVQWVLSRLPAAGDASRGSEPSLELESLRRWIDPVQLDPAERRRMAQAVLDHACSVGHSRLSRSVGVLLAWACPSPAEAVELARPWLETASEENFRALIWVLEPYGETLVFGAPAAVEELFRFAARIGGRSSSRLKSMLSQALNPGVVNVESPVPEYERIANAAEELAGAQTDGSELLALYCEIAGDYRRWSRRLEDESE